MRGLAVAVWLMAATLPARASPPQVLLVKRAGVSAYEEVAEALGERCRVHVRVLSFGDEGPPRLPVTENDVVVTVGQDALDAFEHSGARVIPILALHVPPRLKGPPLSPQPELVLKTLPLATAQPPRTIGLLVGPRGLFAAEAGRAAERAGMHLVTSTVRSGPEAVRALRLLAERVDALWLPGDPDVVTPQVFQYALRLQLERGLPVVAATRQQVHSGALIAADYGAHEAGRVAAELVNHYLETGSLPSRSANLAPPGGARVTVNATVARRLGGRLEALLHAGARLE